MSYLNLRLHLYSLVQDWVLEDQRSWGSGREPSPRRAVAPGPEGRRPFGPFAEPRLKAQHLPSLLGQAASSE